jgi:hypothetical protein
MPNIERSTVETPHRSEDRARFLARLREALETRSFSRLVLAKAVGAGDDRSRVAVREIALGGQRALCFVHSHPTRDITRNLSLDDGVAEIDALIGAAFAHAHLQAGALEAELRVSRKGHATLSVRKGPDESRPAAPGDRAAGHDHAKRRWVDIGRPWLGDLGVTDAAVRLVPSMARKWKQINKFVEIFDGAFAASMLQGRSRVEVVDYGSGKGYLTFALHDHLRHALGLEAQVTGVERRADLVEFCNRAAARSGAAGLRFVEGDVGSAAPAAIDVMIALHACDTATDHALHAGVRAGAAMILCSPCCHKELRPQLRSPAPLAPMLQHGIHLGQQAEMVTDTLRALRLEAEGYATQVFEFVALEHTSKNKMILASKRPPRATQRAAALAHIAEIKSFYGIRTQCLEALLEADAATA